MKCITSIHVKHLFICLYSYTHGFKQLVIQLLVAKRYLTEASLQPWGGAGCSRLAKIHDRQWFLEQNWSIWVCTVNPEVYRHLAFQNSLLCARKNARDRLSNHSQACFYLLQKQVLRKGLLHLACFFTWCAGFTWES